MNAALRGERGALHSSIVAADADSLNAVDLLQFRTRVEAPSTWPFGSGTGLRLALYGVIPIGSSIGGDLVERLIDAAIG